MDGKLHFISFTQGIGYIDQQRGITAQINAFCLLLKSEK